MTDKDYEIEIIITTRDYQNLSDPDQLAADVKKVLADAGYKVGLVDIEGV